MEHSERDLIRRCQDGDQKAFAELVDRHKVIVFNLVDRMIYEKSQVEDLAQEVFIRVFNGLHAFRGGSRLSTWIYRIAYNVCVAELDRTRHRVTFISIDERPDEGGARLELRDEGQDPEALLDRIDFKWTVQAVLDRLPPRYKMILSLYYLEERRYEEIGEVMEIPMGTVKTHLHRAKHALRKAILEQGLWKELSARYSAHQVAE